MELSAPDQPDIAMSYLLPVFEGRELRRLKELHCNLIKFESTDDVADEDQVDFLRSCYATIQNTRPNLSIFFNGVQLDPQRLTFDQYLFGDSLISVHFENQYTNRLAVRPSKSVYQTYYLDVRTFFEPAQFSSFAEWYPNVREVTVHKDHSYEDHSQDAPPIRDAEVSQFFSCCKGLQKLDFNEAGLHSNFYPLLTTMDSCRFLMRLKIFESTEFSHRINFDFLVSLPFLIQFETNAAPNGEMIRCLETMHHSDNQTFFVPGRRFDFHFRTPADQIVISVVKTDRIPRPVNAYYDLPRGEWTLSVYRSSDQIRPIVALNRVTWKTLRPYFNTSPISDLTPHWLDTLPAA